MKNLKLIAVVSCLGLGLLFPNETYARRYHVSLDDGTHQIILAKNKVEALLKFSQLYGCEAVKVSTDTNSEGADVSQHELYKDNGTGEVFKTNSISDKQKGGTAVLSKRKKGGLIAFMSEGKVTLLH